LLRPYARSLDFFRQIYSTIDFFIHDLEEKENDKFRPKVNLVEDDSYDETGRPKQKIALLCGDPGLGKTTCAHIVAKHAGETIFLPYFGR